MKKVSLSDIQCFLSKGFSLSIIAALVAVSGTIFLENNTFGYKVLHGTLVPYVWLCILFAVSWFITKLISVLHNTCSGVGATGTVLIIGIPMLIILIGKVVYGCEQEYFDLAASRYSLPPTVLKAIAIKESSLSPYAINNHGTSYSLTSVEEAVDKVVELWGLGEHNIDVGCMQVNLWWHRHAFNTLEIAFSPKSNIMYGAEVLSRYLSRTKGSYREALSSYHAGPGRRFSARGLRYADDVIRIWETMTPTPVQKPSIQTP